MEDLEDAEEDAKNNLEEKGNINIANLGEDSYEDDFEAGGFYSPPSSPMAKPREVEVVEVPWGRRAPEVPEIPEVPEVIEKQVPEYEPYEDWGEQEPDNKVEARGLGTGEPGEEEEDYDFTL